MVRRTCFQWEQIQVETKSWFKGKTTCNRRSGKWWRIYQPPARWSHHRRWTPRRHARGQHALNVSRSNDTVTLEWQELVHTQGRDGTDISNPEMLGAMLDSLTLWMQHAAEEDNILSQTNFEWSRNKYDAGLLRTLKTLWFCDKTKDMHGSLILSK